MAGIISEKANGSTILLSSVNNNRPILVGIYNGEVVDMAAYSSIVAEMVNLLNRAAILGIVFYVNKKVTKDNVEETLRFTDKLSSPSSHSARDCD